MKLRAATLEDYDFLYNLRRAAMKDYVERIWGWDEAWQEKHFREKFNPAVYQIISIAGKNIGLLSVDERDAEIHINNIGILLEYQNNGIGTRLLKMIITGAGNKPITLQVLKVNPAINLYKRFGFEVTGETETHYQMRFVKSESGEHR